MKPPKGYEGWQEYWVAALTEIDEAYKVCRPDIVLAYGIQHAFTKARLRWPSYDAWEVLGTPDPNDREVCIPVHENHREIQRIEQITEKK